MTTIWKLAKSLIVLVIIGALLWIILTNYSVIFSKTVKGQIVGVEKVETPVVLMTRPGIDMNNMGKIHSFAVGIKTETGEIFIATSDDSRWAVVSRGQCVEAEFLPYPPWDLSKKGAYSGARLVKLYECADLPAPKVNQPESSTPPTRSEVPSEAPATSSVTE